MRKLLNKEQEEFMKSNYTKMTYREMSNLAMFQGLNDKQLRNLGRNLGLKKTRQFDKRYFETIDSNPKAYWLGFLYADGWVSNKEEVGIELDVEDTYILELFCKDLGNKHVIKYRERKKEMNGYFFTSKTSTLRIYSKEMCSDLANLGLIENKTYSSQYPTIETNFFFHFLRGFMDGDGCISNGILSFTNSNPEFLTYLQETIKKNNNINSTIYKEKDFKFRLHFNKAETEKILPFIYKDSKNHCLSRKRNLTTWPSL